jgi:hypothetical protein
VDENYSWLSFSGKFSDFIIVLAEKRAPYDHYQSLILAKEHFENERG